MLPLPAPSTLVLTSLLLALSGLATGASPAAPTDQDRAANTDRLNQWLNTRFDEELRFSPLRKTSMGLIDDQYDKLDDVSLAGDKRYFEWLVATGTALQSKFGGVALTTEGQTSVDLTLYRVQQAQDKWPFRYHSYVLTQFSGAHTGVPRVLISVHKVRNESDLRAWITRAGATGRFLDQVLEQAQASAQRGIRPPRFAYDIVLDEIGKITTGIPFDDSNQPSDLWNTVSGHIARLQKDGTIDQKTATDLTAAARKALRKGMQGGYQRMAAWLQQDRLLADAEPRGVGSLPQGAAWYAERLANQTTTTLSADAIHQLGLAEVARLHQAMNTVLKSLGFDGTLTEFMIQMRNGTDNPRLFFPDTDAGRQAYLDEASAAIDNLRGQLPDWFGTLPKAKLEVRRVELFREQPGAAQHYFSPALDGSRPGIYYAHLSDMTAMPRSQLEVIAYHEGLPGHHLQIALAQELTHLPRFRNHTTFTAYVEGWALYAELLASEMPGTYADPYSQLGRLGSELWRAVRLVVDTGLHAYGWSQQQTLDYIATNSVAPPSTALSEVRRYLVAPGQATSYKIGMLKILELRAEAEAALGKQFDIRAFHDVVLGSGALPMDLLATRVRAWIAQQRSATD